MTQFQIGDYVRRLPYHRGDNWSIHYQDREGEVRRVEDLIGNQLMLDDRMSLNTNWNPNYFELVSKPERKKSGFGKFLEAHNL